MLRETPSLLSRLIELAPALSTEDGQDVLKVCGRLRQDLKAAVDQLQRYAALPQDADDACKCDQSGSLRLPEQFVAQYGERTPQLWVFASPPAPPKLAIPRRRRYYSTAQAGGLGPIAQLVRAAGS